MEAWPNEEQPEPNALELHFATDHVSDSNMKFSHLPDGELLILLDMPGNGDYYGDQYLESRIKLSAGEVNRLRMYLEQWNHA